MLSGSRDLVSAAQTFSYFLHAYLQTRGYDPDSL